MNSTQNFSKKHTFGDVADCGWQAFKRVLSYVWRRASAVDMRWFAWGLISLVATANAMTVQRVGSDVFVSGVIERHDDRLLRAEFDRGDVKRLILVNSPGGDLPAGMAMARWLQGQGVTTLVVGQCLSACSLLFMAGQERQYASAFSYQEKGYRATTNTEFTRLNFKEYKKVFDLKSFQMNKTVDVFYDPKMLSVRQLGKAIDSIQSMDSFFMKKAKIETYPYLKFMLLKDSTQLYKNVKLINQKSFKDLIPAEEKMSVVESAGYQFQSLQNNLTTLVNIYQEQQHAETLHAIEWHRKFTLSFACIVLFLIGAPLGAIIRKGGLGLPLIIAVVLFLTYYFLGVFTYNYAKEGNIHPYLGAWLPTMVMLPLGVFLTYRATHDQGLLSMGPIIGTMEQWWNKWIKQKTT